MLILPSCVFSPRSATRWYILRHSLHHGYCRRSGNFFQRRKTSAPKKEDRSATRRNSTKETFPAPTQPLLRTPSPIPSERTRVTHSAVHACSAGGDSCVRRRSSLSSPQVNPLFVCALSQSVSQSDEYGDQREGQLHRRYLQVGEFGSILCPKPCSDLSYMHLRSKVCPGMPP